MDSSASLILWIVVFILCSAYFSATETAFSSLNKIRIKSLSNEGNKKARLALELAERYDELLSTILIGNNIVNIAASSLGTILFLQVSQDHGAMLSTIVMTIVVLIFGEVSPKSMAKESPEAFAMFSAPIMRVLMMICFLFNRFFAAWKVLLSKIIKPKGDAGITEQELLTIVDEAQSEGGIDEEERDLIKSAIEFNDMEAGEILTPRVDITAIDLDESPEEIAEVFVKSRFSRIPVYQDTIDKIAGVIHQRDFFVNPHATKEEIEALIKPVVYVSDSIKISKLIKHLQKSQSHLAVVTDEYGGTIGIVTMEDILEELVGEIWDEHDDVVEEIEQISENEYLVSGGANVEEVLELFALSDETEQNTVTGWVMEKLEKMPEIGDAFEQDGLSVLVREMDGRRVGKVLMRYTPTEEEEE